MITINRTFEEIYDFYTHAVWPLESMLREMIENYFVRHLDTTNEDEPQSVQITVLNSNASCREDSPVIIKMWINESGDVYFQEKDSELVKDCGDYSLYQLMCIMEHYSKHYEHLCDEV